MKQNERIRIKDIALQAGVSVGTVDRVLHDRSGVSEASRKKVEAILQQLDYQPNMYASALASNKKYNFVCLIPQHQESEYWDDVEAGFRNCIRKYSDFNISIAIEYYDQYEFGSFTRAGLHLLQSPPDGMVIAPAEKSETELVTAELHRLNVPFVFIDSNIPELCPLTFYGQHASQSGYFAARMMKLMTGECNEIVLFRQLYESRLGSNQQLHREEGFQAYLAQHSYRLRTWEMNLDPKDPSRNEAALDEFFNRHPDVCHGITFNSKAYIVGEYMMKRRRTGFHLMGYDLLKRNVDCLRKGYIDFIIAQQPTLQGFSCVESLCNHLILRKPICECNYMPIHLLSVENIEFYLSEHKKQYSQF